MRTAAVARAPRSICVEDSIYKVSWPAAVDPDIVPVLKVCRSSRYPVKSITNFITVASEVDLNSNPHSELETADMEEPKRIDFGPGDDLHVIHREHKRDGSDGSSQPQRPSPPSPYAEHGALIDRSMTAESKTRRGMNKALLWPRIRYHLREPFSEFMGTFILLMFGDGGVAQVVLSRGEKGDYQTISWAWVSAVRSPVCKSTG